MSQIREIRLPALSATMEEATLLSWRVGPGDEVRQGDALAEVSTDKVDMELESPASGVVHELTVDAGAVVKLGEVVATLESDEQDLLAGLDFGESPAASADPGPMSVPDIASTSLPTTPGQAPSEHATGIVPASPPARKMARRMGIDLAEVTPTGTRGQVTPVDVQRHADAPTGTSADGEATTSKAIAATANPSPPPWATDSNGDDAKRRAVRRATTVVMQASAAIPQFTLYRVVELDRASGRKGGESWTTIFLRALAGALRQHPELNARWDQEGESVVPIGSLGAGMAVDRPGVGLVVVTIADPDLMTLGDADVAVRGAADRARTGKLTPPDLARASITLSNLGGMGVDRFNALLFPPQPFIVSTGSIKHRPVATADGALKATLTCEFGLTVDHRVADGADGARLLQSIVEAIG